MNHMNYVNRGNENNGTAGLVNQIRLFLQDPLFLALCILCSIHTGLSLISGDLPLLSILMTIFLWLFYSQGRNGLVAPNYILCISGTVFAAYVVFWVMYCALALVGGLLITVCLFLNTERLLDMLYYKLYTYLGSFIGPYIGTFFTFFTSAATLYLLLFSIGLIFAAIVGIVINIFGTRSIHRFVQSIYKSLEYGQVHIVKCKAAKAWLIVFGVFCGIAALSNFSISGMTNFLAEGCLSAALIIGSLLAGKYFEGFQ